MSIYCCYKEKTPQGYASKFYADTQDDQWLLMSDGEMNGNSDMNNTNFIGVRSPDRHVDVVNKSYVDFNVS